MAGSSPAMTMLCGVIKPLPPPGNLPADWARYKGLYLNGSQVILSYMVGASPVLESASLETAGDLKAFARTKTRAFTADGPGLRNQIRQRGCRERRRTKDRHRREIEGHGRIAGSCLARGQPLAVLLMAFGLSPKP